MYPYETWSEVLIINHLLCAVPPATTNTNMEDKVDTRETDELESQMSTLSVGDSTSGTSVIF